MFGWLDGGKARGRVSLLVGWIGVAVAVAVVIGNCSSTFVL